MSTYDDEATAFMGSVLQQIATGPEHSRDLPQEDAARAMGLVLDEAVDPVQAGVFLIALRMKRESPEENLGILDAIHARTHFARADVERLADLGDPYDGFARGLPVSTFLPAVLAACGLPTIIHGVWSVGPKHGVTHAQILHAAGLSVNLAPKDVATALATPGIGWAYLDQQAYCPKLHHLLALRELIVKRPVLTTVETLIHPVRAAGKTFGTTGYVHRAYPPVYRLLAEQSKFHSVLLVRGVEGGVVPALSQKSLAWRATGPKDLERIQLEPTALGIRRTVRMTPLPEGAETLPANACLAQAAAVAGRAALGGDPGPARDGLLYGSSLCLWHAGESATLEEGAKLAAEAIDSGAALGHFEALGQEQISA